MPRADQTQHGDRIRIAAGNDREVANVEPVTRITFTDGTVLVLDPAEEVTPTPPTLRDLITAIVDSPPADLGDTLDALTTALDTETRPAP